MATDETKADHDRVYACLDRQHGDTGWMTPLGRHVEDALPQKIAAIGLDTNILKYLRRQTLKADELLNYSETNQVPLIIPGQCVQEFWNNHSVFVRDLEGIFSPLQTLKNKVAKASLPQTQQHILDEVEKKLDLFKFEMEDSKRPELLSESFELWRSLESKVLMPYVPRSLFRSLGEVRYSTKVAPGFAEDKPANQALGDFYAWADFLLGLQQAGVSNASESRILFVTDDSKPDWKTSGRPHPMLLGEVHQLTGAILDILGSKAFFESIQDASPRGN